MANDQQSGNRGQQGGGMADRNRQQQQDANKRGQQGGQQDTQTGRGQQGGSPSKDR